MTPRQFAILQHLDRVGWDLQINIVGRARTGQGTARALSMLASAGLVERSPRQFPNQRLVGYQLTAAGEAALVAENLRLLKEITDG